MSNLGWCFWLGVSAGIFLCALWAQVRTVFRRRPRDPWLGAQLEVYDSRGLLASGRVVSREGTVLTVDGLQHTNWAQLYRRRYGADQGLRLCEREPGG